MKSTFEKIGGTYTLGVDGIYYPNLVSTDEEPHYGKYGIMRKTYLKEHRPAMYSLYMLEGRLTEHLNAVDDEAQKRMDISFLILFNSFGYIQWYLLLMKFRKLLLQQ